MQFKKYFPLVFMVVLLVSCLEQKEEKKTNIIYILADDLGYGELGAYGQKIIETPNIDALANGGIKFTNHYSGAPVCAPARCVLLTGQHSGHAYIRGNDEWKVRGDVWNMQAMFDDPNLEGQRPMPDSITTIGELLQEGGYATGMVGKWGLGSPTTNSIPNKQGFDYFLGYNCQRQAHTFYPMHLWENEEKKLLDNKMVVMHANMAEDADPDEENSYADFNLNDYSPDVMHEGAMKFIKSNAGNPFFLYYASPIPHVPLQAPKKWVEYYRKKIGPEEPFTGKSYFPCQYPKATYAAMISTLDEQVGEIVALLKALDLYENTIVMFSSDNGPTYTGGTDTPYFDSAHPFSTEYGYGKGFVREGGIRVPMIAHWPGKIKLNSESNHVSAFHDIMPTLCDIAGIEPPKTIDGISFLPSLIQNNNQVKHEYLYWEFPSYKGQQAVRMGKWKGIRKEIFDGNMDIQLYDLSIDSLETKDLANEYPDILEQIATIMKEARTEPELDRFKIEELGDVRTNEE